jgi:hypothetical protein
VFAEVIKGGFGGKAAVDSAVESAVSSAPYVLPDAARIGLPVLDQAHAALLARLNAAHRALSSGHEAEARLQLELLRSDLAMQLLCLIKGSWTEPMMQRIPVRVTATRPLPR